MTATKLCLAICTNLHSFPNAKQHRAWIVLGCETVFIFDDDDRAVISATEISNDFEVVVKLSKSLAICQKTAEALNLFGFFSKPKSKSTETKTTLTFFGSKENRFGRKTSNKLWWLQHFFKTRLWFPKNVNEWSCLSIQNFQSFLRTWGRHSREEAKALLSQLHRV